MIETVRDDTGISFLFFAFLLGGAFVVLLEYLYPELFRRDTRHLFYFSGLNSQQRNARTYVTYRILALILFAFTFALFFFVCMNRVFPSRSFPFSFLGAVFLVTGCFLFLRYLADRFLAWLFDVRMQVERMLEKETAFRLAFGVYGLVALFILTYSDLSSAFFSGNILWYFFALYILVYLAVAAEYLVGDAKYIFYFILYLCVVEICPAIIAWSLFSRTLT